MRSLFLKWITTLSLILRQKLKFFIQIMFLNMVTSHFLTKKKKTATSKKQFVNVNKKASKPSRYGKLFAEEEK